MIKNKKENPEWVTEIMSLIKSQEESKEGIPPNKANPLFTNADNSNS